MQNNLHSTGLKQEHICWMSETDRAVLHTQSLLQPPSPVKFWYCFLQSAKLGCLENNCVSNSHCHLSPSTVFKLNVNYLKFNFLSNKENQQHWFPVMSHSSLPNYLWRTFAWIKQKKYVLGKTDSGPMLCPLKSLCFENGLQCNKEPVPGLCHVLALPVLNISLGTAFLGQ